MDKKLDCNSDWRVIMTNYVCILYKSTICCKKYFCSYNSVPYNIYSVQYTSLCHVIDQKIQVIVSKNTSHQLKKCKSSTRKCRSSTEKVANHRSKNVSHQPKSSTQKKESLRPKKYNLRKVLHFVVYIHIKRY